jgi:two-component system, cell cycle sensor histidine kinase and response regulator CckA
VWSVSVVVCVAATIAYVWLVRAPGVWTDASDTIVRELERVADTRHAMLDEWVGDAIADAETVADFPSVARLFQRAAGWPSPPPDADLADILTNFAERQGYAHVVLKGPDTASLLASPGAVVTPDCQAAARAAIRAGGPAVDIHEHPAGPMVGVVVPAAVRGETVGVVLLEASLDVFARALASRPTTDGTATIALFVEDRRTGGERAVTMPPAPGAPPLALASLQEPDLGAGTPVLATARRLEHAPWTLVMALPQAPLDAELRQRLWRAALLWSFAIAASVTVILLLLWSRELAVEARVATDHARLGHLLDAANDAVLFVDTRGHIRHCNASAERLYGRPAQELVGQHGVRHLRPPREHQAGTRQFETVLRNGELVYETVHLAADGREIPVEISANRVRVGQDEWVVAVVRDIAERKAAEARIQRLNRLLRTMSEVRQTIATEPESADLLGRLCEVAVGTGGFELAWIARAERDGTVRPVAVAGPRASYVSALSARWDDSTFAEGPAGDTIRRRKAVLVPNVQADPRVAPWRDRLLAHGLQSVASSPVFVRGDVYGAVLLYAAEAHAFDADTTGLVEELAADIGLVLERIEQRAIVAGQAQAVSEQAARYRALLGTSLDGIVVLDLEGRVVEANEGFYRMLGYGPEDERPTSVSDWDVQFTREELADAFAAAHGRSVLLDSRQRRRDGSIITVEISAAGVTIGQEQLIYCAQRDITERSRAAEALRRSEAQFRAVFDYAGLGIAMRDLSGRPIRVNAAFQRMLGCSEAELQQMRFDEFTQADDLAVERPLFDELVRGAREHYELDKRYVHRSGATVWTSVTVSLVRDRDGHPLFAVVLGDDITERRRLQEQFLQAQKMEGIGRLAGGVAHDFNNLLTAIMGYAELVRADLPPDDAAHGFLEEITKAGARAAALTTQLLAFARKQVIEPRPVDLNAVVRDAEKMLRRLVGEDVEMIVHLGIDLGIVQVDPGQVGQILINLAVNARDAMPEGGRLVIETANAFLDEHYARTHVDVTPGDYVMLAVSDTGHGMPPEVQAKLFEPFFTTKGRDRGTGLGLATCHGIVKQAGGSIQVYSEPSLGSTFRIYFPRVQQRLPDEPERQTTPALRGGHETVLLAEDEPAVRHLASLSLRSHGYHVLEASTGADALALARATPHRIALLVSDVVMPGMNGRELAERFREICPSADVLFVSGHAESAIVHHGAVEPGTAFLPKPFTPERLARRVRELLDAAAARRPVPGPNRGPGDASLV